MYSALRGSSKSDRKQALVNLQSPGYRAAITGADSSLGATAPLHEPIRLSAALSKFIRCILMT